MSSLLGSSLTTFFSLPIPVQIAVALAGLASLSLLYTRVYGAYRYRRDLAKFAQKRSSDAKQDEPLAPPKIPYNIPILGLALPFLAPKPGLFWSWLFTFHPPDLSGCCTLLLGGRTAHLLHNPASVQALFKSKNADRLDMNINIARTSLGMPDLDVQKYHGINGKGQRLHFENEEDDPLHLSEKINLDYLLKGEAVSELTAEFMRFFAMQLKSLSVGDEFVLGEWLRSHMFEASGRALLGDKVFEYYPSFCVDFWPFERSFLSLFFGIPEFMIREAVNNRERVINGMSRFHEGLERDGLYDVVSSTAGPRWEPNFGSRVNRARQEAYNKMDLSRRSRAGFDLGFTFGLASNAIPATIWMLLHILDPNADSAILPRVMAELKSTRNPDGTINLNALFSLPLLQSIWQEVLRLYTDVLVTRNLEKDHILPTSGGRNILLKKGSMAMAPSWLGQRNPDEWTEGQPYDVFYHERFLKTDPETDKDVFTTANTAGRLFPFGGGKSICPGRSFAKQEVFGAVALLLLGFELEVKTVVDEQGKETKQFPGLKDGFGGSGIISQSGDYRLIVKRKL